jgi:hypothetical protein
MLRSGEYNEHTVAIVGLGGSVTWYPTKITAVKHDIMLAKNTKSVHGLQVGLSFALAADEDSEKGELVTLWMVSIGGVYNTPRSPFNITYGFVYDDYIKSGIYVGFEMPIRFFN